MVISQILTVRSSDPDAINPLFVKIASEIMSSLWPVSVCV